VIQMRVTRKLRTSLEKKFLQSAFGLGMQLVAKSAQLRASVDIDTAVEKVFPAHQLTSRLMSGVSLDAELSQSELCNLFGVTDQTVRNWTLRGLPWRKGPLGKPRYPKALATVWGQCWTLLEAQKKTPRWLAPSTALFLTLLNQYESDAKEPWAERHGQAFAIVPLDWDHPFREIALRVASRGTMPPCDLPGAPSQDGEMPSESFFDALTNRGITNPSRPALDVGYRPPSQEN
jgi:hypothetical protein